MMPTTTALLARQSTLIAIPERSFEQRVAEILAQLSGVRTLVFAFSRPASFWKDLLKTAGEGNGKILFISLLQFNEKPSPNVVMLSKQLDFNEILYVLDTAITSFHPENVLLESRGIMKLYHDRETINRFFAFFSKRVNLAGARVIYCLSKDLAEAKDPDAVTVDQRLSFD
ncbi:hypothetical protein HY493_05765 [Candidatus Woesearchaeota archaeon]|nr:hypothetical protein [Candidatus Woesearchaeota archaeon]